ncbi:Uncharacterised protein [Cedecea lapagei]|uniref:Uncharacterized protein n=1 Tax=Cedecea lapagei TaxID=158823 RepID=A0A447V5Z3_9ENTR|nr:Uncharacterised protein [Cedecea lapagei]
MHVSKPPPGSEAFDIIPELHCPKGALYVVKTASDAHTTADRAAVSAEALIQHHNEVWANLSIPGNTLAVKTTAAILEGWS